MIIHIYRLCNHVTNILIGGLYKREHFEDNLTHYLFLSLIYTYTYTLYSFWLHGYIIEIFRKSAVTCWLHVTSCNQKQAKGGLK